MPFSIGDLRVHYIAFLSLWRCCCQQPQLNKDGARHYLLQYTIPDEILEHGTEAATFPSFLHARPEISRPPSAFCSENLCNTRMPGRPVLVSSTSQRLSFQEFKRYSHLPPLPVSLVLTPCSTRDFSLSDGLLLVLGGCWYILLRPQTLHRYSIIRLEALPPTTEQSKTTTRPLPTPTICRFDRTGTVSVCRRSLWPILPLHAVLNPVFLKTFL